MDKHETDKTETASVLGPAAGSMPSLGTFNRDVKCGAKDGRYSFDCRMGLWGVDGPDMVNAFSSAWRYYVQYFSDGEYRSQSNERNNHE